MVGNPARPTGRRDRHAAESPPGARERYHSAAFAQLEAERMWPKVWQVACTVDHVAEPGYFEYRNGHYSVLIVRDDDGTLVRFRTCAATAATRCSGRIRTT